MNKESRHGENIHGWTSSYRLSPKYLQKWLLDDSDLLGQIQLLISKEDQKRLQSDERCCCHYNINHGCLITVTMSAGFQRYRDNGRSSSSASKAKNKVHNLLRELETEFDKIIIENAQLRERITTLENQNDEDASRGATNLDTTLTNKGSDDHDLSEKNVLKSFTKNKAIKTRQKLKVQTSKIVSSFKPPTMSCMLVKEFRVGPFTIVPFFSCFN